MLTLLSQARFWTFRDEVATKNSDFGAFRYHEKKDVTDTPYNEGKRSYAEKRGMTWLPQNKRPNKLKDSLKELEDVIAHHKVVFCQWRDNCVVQLMVSSGLLINICVNVSTGDILRVMVDKFLVGKLLSEHIADVILTKTHLLCSYNDSQLTLVYFTKPAMKWNDKMSRLDPKVQTLELGGPSGRRLERKLSCNIGGDMILIWWRCTRDEVYPWSPLVKDQDRANVHVYSINGIKAELLCYYRTEFDPVCVLFSKVQANVIHSVEQKVTRKGEVTVESCTYEISKCRLQRTSVTSIPLQTQVCCHGFSPDEEKLLLGCIDGSLVLFDEGRGITHLVKAAFISTMVAWHPDGALVVVANERSQLQCYDVALACIKHQLLSEDVTPSNLLDLASYFRNQPTLIQMLWARKPDVVQHRAEGFAQTDALLLLHFERGPLAVLRLVAGGGMQGDIHGTGLTPDVLVTQYLSVNQVDRAINLLLSLNWDSYGLICLASLHRISNYLFRQPLTPEREVQLQTAVGSFHVPLRPICHATEVEFGGQVRHLTRRFFHHLLRYRLFEKAFRLAIDLNDHDLFMDIYHYARYMNEGAMAEAAREKAEQILNHSSTGSSSDTGSHSSCSDCPSGDGTSSEAESEIPPQPPPPLPRQQQKVKFSDTVTHILVPDLPPPLPEEHPHSNKEYLKDFTTTIPDVSEEEDNGNGTIKIVHFGVV